MGILFFKNFQTFFEENKLQSRYFGTLQSLLTLLSLINVTLLVEMKDKEFTSHKANYALQFGTNNNMIGLSLTFKSIKQKIQFSQHFELISFLMF